MLDKNKINITGYFWYVPSRLFLWQIYYSLFSLQKAPWLIREMKETMDISVTSFFLLLGVPLRIFPITYQKVCRQFHIFWQVCYFQIFFCNFRAQTAQAYCILTQTVNGSLKNTTIFAGLFLIAKSLLLLKILSFLSHRRLFFIHLHHLPEDSTARRQWFMHPCTQISLLLWIPCVVFSLTSLFKWGRPLINSFQTPDLPVSDRQPYTTRIIYLQALNRIVSSWCSSALSWRNKQSVFKPSNDWDLPWLTNSISFEVASDN